MRGTEVAVAEVTAGVTVAVVTKGSIGGGGVFLPLLPELLLDLLERVCCAGESAPFLFFWFFGVLGMMFLS